MRFFKNEIASGRWDYFYKQPTEFNRSADKSILSVGLGGILYMPANRRSFVQEIISKKYDSSTAIVLDLEDALGDLELESAENQVVNSMEELSILSEKGIITIVDLPMIFIRVRNQEQLNYIISKLGILQKLLTGYVLPKFSTVDGSELLKSIQDQCELGYRLFAMPILESVEVLNKETRMNELLKLREILRTYSEIILNIRLGSTDFCGYLGLRRGISQTIYDVLPVRDCIADIINVFARCDENFVLSGSVWEYFGSEEAELGLINELKLDQLNGLIGKTLIHPTQIEFVRAMYVVSYEEYQDATSIMLNSRGEIGVKKSEYNNKMNEMKPHKNWAERILIRAYVYGVLKPQYNYLNLLSKGVKHEL